MGIANGEVVISGTAFSDVVMRNMGSKVSLRKRRLYFGNGWFYNDAHACRYSQNVIEERDHLRAWLGMDNPT